MKIPSPRIWGISSLENPGKRSILELESPYNACVPTRRVRRHRCRFPSAHHPLPTSATTCRCLHILRVLSLVGPEYAYWSVELRMYYTTCLIPLPIHHHPQRVPYSALLTRSSEIFFSPARGSWAILSPPSDSRAGPRNSIPGSGAKVGASGKPSAP